MQDAKIWLSFFRVCTFTWQKFFYFKSQSDRLFGATFTFFASEPHCDLVGAVFISMGVILFGCRKIYKEMPVTHWSRNITILHILFDK